MNREVVHDGKGAFQVRFAFERRLVDRIKSLPNRRWNASDRLWLVPEEDVLPLVELLADDRFRFCDTTVRLYQERGGRLTVNAAPMDLFTDLEEIAAAEAEPAPAPAPAGDWTVSRLNQRVRIKVKTDEEWSLELLREDGVLVQPGYFYDFAGEAYLVVSLLPTEAVFDEGLARIVRRVAAI